MVDLVEDRFKQLLKEQGGERCWVVCYLHGTQGNWAAPTLIGALLNLFSASVSTGPAHQEKPGRSRLLYLYLWVN